MMFEIKVTIRDQKMVLLVHAASPLSAKSLVQTWASREHKATPSRIEARETPIRLPSLPAVMRAYRVQ